MDKQSKIILISGPTASGKSSFAIKIAKKINGEVINADSMQVYKQLKILTARRNKKAQKNIKNDDSKEDVTKDDSKEKKNYIKNKFINKGKMRDLNILQNNGEKVVVKKQNPVQYQSYKQWRNPDANVF